MQTRREFGARLLAAIPALWLPQTLLAEPRPGPFSSKFHGVQLGVQTYSYRALRPPQSPFSLDWQKRVIDLTVDAIAQDRINFAEFWIGMIEPAGGIGAGSSSNPANAAARERLRRWRASRPMEAFLYARQRFAAAGIVLYSCMYNFDDQVTDDEIECAFDMARALGCPIITANCTVASIRRIAPFATRHRVIVAAHSEDAPFDPDIDGMVFADNLLAATALSPFVRITLDIGHFWAYGGDPVRFMREHHDRIVNLHVKDRLKNHPEPHSATNDLAFGKGDTPIVPVLRLMRDQMYTFPAMIEYEYQSAQSPVVEVANCLTYMRSALV
jgi:sugar phosphate isomerase/epimerase